MDHFWKQQHRFDDNMKMDLEYITCTIVDCRSSLFRTLSNGALLWIQWWTLSLVEIINYSDRADPVPRTRIYYYKSTTECTRKMIGLVFISRQKQQADVITAVSFVTIIGQAKTTLRVKDTGKTMEAFCLPRVGSCSRGIPHSTVRRLPRHVCSLRQGCQHHCLTAKFWR